MATIKELVSEYRALGNSDDEAELEAVQAQIKELRESARALQARVDAVAPAKRVLAEKIHSLLPEGAKKIVLRDSGEVFNVMKDAGGNYVLRAFRPRAQKNTTVEL